jgi:hypothetical protein
VTQRLLLLLFSLTTLISCRPRESPDIAHLPDGTPYSLQAYQTGEFDAENDLRANRLVVENWGFPMKGQNEYAKILREKYSVEFKRVAGDIVDGQTVGHAKGYNELSEAEIKRRFGNDVFEKAKIEAEREYGEKQ